MGHAVVLRICLGCGNQSYTRRTGFCGPPPALGDVAVEELEISRHKRNNLSHIFLCPRLMTYAWRKRLIKICDAVLSIPPGSRTFWPATEHEPLILGLTLRFSPCSPWQVKRCPQFLALAGELHGMWSRPEGDVVP
jgi:hypothetical protein